MKRFISLVCLLVGASVASYAGLINSTAGFVGTSYLQSFNDSSFTPLGVVGTTLPLTSFFPTGIPVGASGVNVTITSAGPNPGDPNAGRNTGATGAMRTGSGLTTGYYVSTESFGNGSDATNFARRIIFTFSSNVSDFLIDYFGSNNPTSNYFFLNNDSATQYTLAAADADTNDQNGQIGFGNGAFNKVTFVIYGNDEDGTLGGDSVLFDNLVVGIGSGSSGSSGSTGGGDDGDGDVDGDGGGGEVPEPTTYALMGAGLVALAYARSKKK